MDNFYRFSKTNTCYAPQVIWLADGRKFFLHPHEHSENHAAKNIVTIDQEKTPINWKEIFSLFSFASIFDLAAWVHWALHSKDVFMLNQLKEIISAAGFRFDIHILEEFDFFYQMKNSLKEQTYKQWVALADKKNVPLRVLVQLAKIFLEKNKNTDKSEQQTMADEPAQLIFLNESEYFFSHVTSILLQDYIKNNTARELLKMLADISPEKNLQVLEEMETLEQQTHYDNRNRLNYFYYQLVQKYRYPMFVEFTREINILQEPLLKKQKNLRLQFHPAYEKSEFTLEFVIKNKKNIDQCKDFFTEENNQTLQNILNKLLYT